MGARQAPDRMLFARPRQPAAGRRPPLYPEHAATGRPLPRVTATDDSVPPSTTAVRRPTPAATWLSRRRTPGRRPTRRTTDLASTHRLLALSGSARTLQG